METYLNALQNLLNDPTSNLAATAIGLAIVALFAIILILILLIWAVSSQPTKKGPKRKGTGAVADTTAGNQKTSGKSRTRRPLSRTARILIGATILTSLVVAYGGTSTDTYCTTVCHAMSDAQDSRDDSAHSSVSCTRCHEGIPVLSAANAVGGRARSIYFRLTRAHVSVEPIPGARCMSCHSDIRDEPVLGPQAVLMSHLEVLDAGMDCTDCHGEQGHTSESLHVGMSACIVCHDGEEVSAECTMCHPEGAEASIEVTQESFGQPVQLPENPTCGGCHPQDTCDECHGVRMPHPEDYALGVMHARTAAFDGKQEICYRCHTTAECYRCHLNFNAHGANWDVRHRTASRDWCRSCHKPETENMCSLCHD